MKRRIKRLVKLLLICLSVVIFVILGTLAYLFSFRFVDAYEQKQHVKKLVSMYQENDQSSMEQRFVNFDLDNDHLKLNEVQYLATHNSYKKRGSALANFIVRQVISPEEARELRYGYHSLTEQLQQGIRSFELDIRYRGDTFEITHVPMVDARTSAQKLELALKEIKLYSENHPDHIPIILLMEIKDDWMILDPALRDYDRDAFQKLDKQLKEALGDKLFTPQHMMQPNQTLNQTIKTSGWPTIQSLLGKVMIVMHPGVHVFEYVDMDRTLSMQAMFPGVNHYDLNQDYASFVLYNTPVVREIQSIVSAGYIVRTRMDTGLNYNEVRAQNAIRSGAQLLTSDFTVGRSDLDDEHVIYLQSSYTVIKNQ